MNHMIIQLKEVLTHDKTPSKNKFGMLNLIVSKYRYNFHCQEILTQTILKI